MRNAPQRGPVARLGRAAAVAALTAATTIAGLATASAAGAATIPNIRPAPCTSTTLDVHYLRGTHRECFAGTGETFVTLPEVSTITTGANYGVLKLRELGTDIVRFHPNEVLRFPVLREPELLLIEITRVG